MSKEWSETNTETVCPAECALLCCPSCGGVCCVAASQSANPRDTWKNILLAMAEFLTQTRRLTNII